MFLTAVRGGKAFAVKQKLRELKKITFFEENFFYWLKLSRFAKIEAYIPEGRNFCYFRQF